jgi:hypothetical protein
MFPVHTLEKSGDLSFQIYDSRNAKCFSSFGRKCEVFFYTIQSRNSNPNYELQRGLLELKMFLFLFFANIALYFLFAIFSLINIISIKIIDIAKFIAKLLLF